MSQTYIVDAAAHEYSHLFSDFARVPLNVSAVSLSVENEENERRNRLNLRRQFVGPYCVMYRPTDHNLACAHCNHPGAHVQLPLMVKTA